MSNLGELARLSSQASDPALVLRRGKWAPPEQGVPDAVVEAANARAANVCLAGVPAPLVVRHLRESRLMSRVSEVVAVAGCRWRYIGMNQGWSPLLLTRSQSTYEQSFALE